MKKYKITMSEWHHTTIIVEAENLEAAQEFEQVLWRGGEELDAYDPVEDTSGDAHFQTEEVSD